MPNLDSTGAIDDEHAMRNAARRRMLDAVAKGQSIKAAMGAAIQAGLDEAMVSEVAAENRAALIKARKAYAMRLIILGGALFIGGGAIVIPLYNYSHSYVSAPGVIAAFGGYLFVINLNIYLRPEK